MFEHCVSKNSVVFVLMIRCVCLKNILIIILFSDLLTQLNPALDLKSCSVFVRPTPPPLVHHVEHRATQLPLTSSAYKLSFSSLFSLLIVAMSILCHDL